MFAKMFKKKIATMSGNKKQNELIEKINSMDLYAMRHYINSELATEFGIKEIVTKLITKDTKTKRRFLEENDSPYKIDKCLDLFIVICEHDKTSSEIVDLLRKFPSLYYDIISEHDEKHKKKYDEVIKNALFFITKKLGLDEEEQITACKLK